MLVGALTIILDRGANWRFFSIASHVPGWFSSLLSHLPVRFMGRQQPRKCHSIGLPIYESTQIVYLTVWKILRERGNRGPAVAHATLLSSARASVEMMHGMDWMETRRRHWIFPRIKLVLIFSSSPLTDMSFTEQLISSAKSTFRFVLSKKSLFSIIAMPARNT